MKKKYLVPSMEVTTTYAICDTSTISGGDTTRTYTVKGRKDEDYDSEDGSYGDLW